MLALTLLYSLLLSANTFASSHSLNKDPKESDIHSRQTDDIVQPRNGSLGTHNGTFPQYNGTLFPSNYSSNATNSTAHKKPGRHNPLGGPNSYFNGTLNGTEANGTTNANSTTRPPLNYKPTTTVEIPVATFTAVPHPKINVSDVKNVVPEASLNLAFANPGDEKYHRAPQVIDIKTKLKGNAVALDNVGGINSVHCKDHTILIDFENKAMAENAKSTWDPNNPFYILTERPGCQDPEDALAHRVRAMNWSNDGKRVSLEKDTVFLHEIVDEMDGDFGIEKDPTANLTPVGDIPAERPAPVDNELLSANRNWTEQQRNEIEDLLLFDPKLDAELGRAYIANSGNPQSQNNSSSQEFKRNILRRSSVDEKTTAYSHNRLQRRGWLSDIEDFFTKKIPNFFTKTIPDAFKSVGKFVVDLSKGIYQFGKAVVDLIVSGNTEYSKEYKDHFAANDMLKKTLSPWGDAVELITLEYNGNVLQAYCVDCYLKYSLKFAGHFEVSVPRNKYGAAVTIDGDLDFNLLLGIHARTKGLDAETSMTLFDIPLGPISIAGIFNLGPSIRLDVGVNFNVEAIGNLLIGANVRWDEVHVGVGVGSLEHLTSTELDWIPKINPTLDVQARVEISSGIFADIIPSFNIRILFWTKGAGIKQRISIDVTAVASLDFKDDKDDLLDNGKIGNNTVGNGNNTVGKENDTVGKDMEFSDAQVRYRPEDIITNSPESRNPADMELDDSQARIAKRAEKKKPSEFEVDTKDDLCQNGVQFSVSLNFETFVFIFNWEKSLFKYEVPIYESQCFPILGDLAKRAEDIKFEVSVDQAPELRLYVTELGNVHLVDAKDTNQTFAFGGSQMPEDFSQGIEKDDSNRYFTMFDTIAEQGVSRLRMVKNDYHLFAAQRVTFVHIGNSTAAVDFQNEKIYIPVACETEIGVPQLFLMSPDFQIDLDKINDVINQARNPPLVPHAGVGECAPVNLVLTPV